MEDNKEKNFDDKTMFHEDFKDFDEEENSIPEIDEDLASSEIKKEIEKTLEQPQEEIVQIEEKKPTQQEQELSAWEELDENNSVVKKYIFYVSKDFVPYIDKLTTDERSAYINDAIQKKIDLEDEQKQKNLKKKLKR